MTDRIAAALSAAIAPLSADVDEDTVHYMAGMLEELVEDDNYDEEEWAATVQPVLEEEVGGEEGVLAACRAAIAALTVGDGGDEWGEEYAEEGYYDENGEYIYYENGQAEGAEHGQPEEEEEDWSQATVLIDNPSFTLGFMSGKVLLDEAALRIERGKRYGLVGENGAGKTTLMKKLATKELPDFPPKLRVVYVQHEIAGDPLTTVLDFAKAVCNEAGSTQDPSAAPATLEAVGFNDKMQQGPIEELSGGWRMRLAIARAMLLNCDVLLLDEPTNHLDYEAVQWLTNWLQEQAQVAVLLVSHEPDFLEAVCTNIIHINNQKLTQTEEKWSSFDARQPKLTTADLKKAQREGRTLEFRFPKPNKLHGVSGTRNLLSMKNVDFQYNERRGLVLKNVTAALKLNSRTACVGPNGAGKSTLIKLLVGELQPSNHGVAKSWRHHDLRVAYVAQHSFFHLDAHLEQTPCMYIQERFRHAVDKESAVMKAAAAAEEKRRSDLKKQGKPLSGRSQRHTGRQPEVLLARRKRGKTLEYEVKWEGLAEWENTWEELAFLEKLGAYRLIAACDEEIRGKKAGIDKRALTNAEVLVHLKDFGLAKNYALGRCVQLSGGQKARLVLAAAMWNCPHVLVLDEPTNYLDLEALAALSRAIKKFKGGVVMVSHHEGFVSSLCDEVWKVDNGEMTITKKKGKRVDGTKEHDMGQKQ